MTARVAIYYAPTFDDPLSCAGTIWLGRDPITNAPVAQPGIPGLADITSDPRRYGFHATLKPPMRLAQGQHWQAFLDAAIKLARTLRPFELPPLAVMDLHGFLALRETRSSPELQHLADACVQHLDVFRAPSSADEIARRRGSRLTAEQDSMLLRWGYPYVLETWFFHMTLTRRLTSVEKAQFMPLAAAHFAEALKHPRRVADICLFTQATTDASFTLAERLPLLG